MFNSDEDGLIAVGAVAVADGTDQHDTTSDRSEWVRQYTDWTEGGNPMSVNVLRERSATIQLPSLSTDEGAPEGIDDYCMVL
jgi:hypothetical protein